MATTPMTTAFSARQLQMYEAAKTSVGWIEQPVGVIAATGADTLDLLQRLTTNDINQLNERNGMQTVLLTEKARFLDLITVLKRDSDVLLITSYGAVDEILAWFDKYIFIDDVRLRDMSDACEAVQIIGREVDPCIAELTGTGVRDMPIGGWRAAELFGAPTTLVRLPTMCESSFLALTPTEDHEDLIEGLQSLAEMAPEIDDIVFETLRIEAGLGKSGFEWTLDYNPLEAGLIQLVSFTKGCYIGQEVIARLDSYNKVKQRLMGFISDSPIPLGGEFRDGARTIGKITSVARSPELDKYIALGYIRSSFANPGAALEVYQGEDITTRVEVANLPLLV